VWHIYEIDARSGHTLARDSSNLPSTGMEGLRGQIHLWYSSLDLPRSTIQQLKLTLDSNERTRANRICSDLERNRFIVGRGLLRKILGHYSGIEPTGLHIICDCRGKPALREAFGEPQIHFNLAHSCGRVLYAIALDRKVGVDLERVTPNVDSEQIANRFFSDREKAVIHGLAGIDKQKAFFTIWTAKEAYSKAFGTGLAYTLKEVEIPDYLAPLSSVCSGSNDSRWFIWWLSPERKFMAALVVQEPLHHPIMQNCHSGCVSGMLSQPYAAR